MSETKLGDELRATADKANAKAEQSAYERQLETMRKAVKDVIIPGIKKSGLAEQGKYEMYFKNATCGWDYLWFAWNDKTKNYFMVELEAELKKHGLRVRYHVDWEQNHWDRDSIEGIYVCWK